MVTHRRPSVLRSSALMFALLTALGLVLGAVLSDARAQTAPQYTFTKVADSTEDGFDPNNFGCAAINARGDIAFRAGRLAPDGFNTIDGIYRANSDGTLTTIAEDQRRFVFIGVNPSINDAGQVSFAARLDGGKKPDTESILRGDGRKLTTIATTADRFNFFGFDTSINNNGDVAFLADLDSGGSGVFVGPDPINDRVIFTGDALDGSTVRNITFCEEGLSDSGELAFVAQLADNPDTPEDDSRTAVFRATPVP